MVIKQWICLHVSSSMVAMMWLKRTHAYPGNARSTSRRSTTIQRHTWRSFTPCHEAHSFQRGFPDSEWNVIRWKSRRQHSRATLHVLQQHVTFKKALRECKPPPHVYRWCHWQTAIAYICRSFSNRAKCLIQWKNNDGRSYCTIPNSKVLEDIVGCLHGTMRKQSVTLYADVYLYSTVLGSTPWLVKMCEYRTTQEATSTLHYRSEYSSLPEIKHHTSQYTLTTSTSTSISLTSSNAIFHSTPTVPKKYLLPLNALSYTELLYPTQNSLQHSTKHTVHCVS